MYIQYFYKLKIKSNKRCFLSSCHSKYKNQCCACCAVFDCSFRWFAIDDRSGQSRLWNWESFRRVLISAIHKVSAMHINQIDRQSLLAFSVLTTETNTYRDNLVIRPNWQWVIRYSTCLSHMYMFPQRQIRPQDTIFTTHTRNKMWQRQKYGLHTIKKIPLDKATLFSVG